MRLGRLGICCGFMGCLLITGCPIYVPIEGEQQQLDAFPAPGNYYNDGNPTFPGQTTGTADGGVFVAGLTRVGSKSWVSATRIAANGVIAWSHVLEEVYPVRVYSPYPNRGQYADGLFRIHGAFGTGTQDGGGVLVGATEDIRYSSEYESLLITKFGATGSVAWSDTFGSDYRRAAQVIERSDGTIMAFHHMDYTETTDSNIAFTEYEANGVRGRTVVIDRMQGIDVGGQPTFAYLYPAAIKLMEPGVAAMAANTNYNTAAAIIFDLDGRILHQVQLFKEDFGGDRDLISTFDLEPLADGTFLWGLYFVDRERDEQDQPRYGAVYSVRLDSSLAILAIQEATFPIEPGAFEIPVPRDIAASNGIPYGIVLNQRRKYREYAGPWYFLYGDSTANEIAWIPFDASASLLPEERTTMFRHASRAPFFHASAPLADGRLMGVGEGYTTGDDPTSILLFEIRPDGTMGALF